jgi:hypothetical protein
VTVLVEDTGMSSPSSRNVKLVHENVFVAEYLRSASLPSVPVNSLPCPAQVLHLFSGQLLGRQIADSAVPHRWTEEDVTPAAGDTDLHS